MSSYSAESRIRKEWNMHFQADTMHRNKAWKQIKQFIHRMNKTTFWKEQSDQSKWSYDYGNHFGVSMEIKSEILLTLNSVRAHFHFWCVDSVSFVIVNTSMALGSFLKKRCYCP